jgi:hypothetical protein
MSGFIGGFIARSYSESTMISLGSFIDQYLSLLWVEQ